MKNRMMIEHLFLIAVALCLATTAQALPNLDLSRLGDLQAGLKSSKCEQDMHPDQPEACTVLMRFTPGSAAVEKIRAEKLGDSSPLLLTGANTKAQKIARTPEEIKAHKAKCEKIEKDCMQLSVLGQGQAASTCLLFYEQEESCDFSHLDYP